MYAHAAKVYKQVDLESASKSQILDRLYLRFIKDCVDAQAAMGRKDIEAKTAAINHGDQIIMELVAALDHSLAPELCGNLAALYDFVLDRLGQANITNDPEHLEQAILVVTQLRDAFLEANAAGAERE